ncbi:2-oxoacid:acceptor oxidoreductase family protein [Consotaella aegiceratis]|uniref:2-oxoacid:acceptor oxidoreductase family protein n=1 Tax=Consotaella aegiceratis TaxID=3097961 RepID=UPI002F3FD69C
MAAGGAADRAAFDLLLPVGGKTVLELTVEALRDAGLTRIFGVYRRQDQRMAQTLNDLGVADLATDDMSEAGQVRCALGALSPLLDGCLVLPGNLPLLRPMTVDRVLRQALETAAPVVHPTFRGLRGYPLFLDRALFGTIDSALDDGGLDMMLERYQPEAGQVAVFDHGCVLADAPAQDLLDVLAHHHAPDDAECEAMLVAADLDEPVCRHCRMVADFATMLAERLVAAGIPLDIDLIRSAALLHDIGKGHARHADVGSGLLRIFGFPEVADLVVDHHLGRSFDGTTLDEGAVLYLAEKLIEGERQVSLTERFAPMFSRFDGDPRATSGIKDRLAKAEAILQAVTSQIGTPHSPFFPSKPPQAVGQREGFHNDRGSVRRHRGEGQDIATASSNRQGGDPRMDTIDFVTSDSRKAKYPGHPEVINGNGAVAYVMGQVCGGVIGYPITPSTEISETFELYRAAGGMNVWGKHPFFYEPEGEHSAQSGALGAALTGGKYVSNASSSQGILYGLESHYVTVGKKVGGFVLQVAARVVSKHSLNVMAGHDDVYALLPSGYTVMFGSNPEEAADLAAISYRTAAMSLVPVANCMDGFATSHMMSEAYLPEPELLKEYLGDPQSRIEAPTVAQEILFGAKGRVSQLRHWLLRHRSELGDEARGAIETYLQANAEAIEKDAAGALLPETLGNVPENLRGQWRRQWLNAWEKGTRQLVPALVDVDNPGLTGGVQNQPDFQAGAVDHLSHFAADVPALARQAMAEYSALTGRTYTPLKCYRCEDAETVMIGLGSVTEDVEAVVDYLRSQGRKVGSISVKLLQPFPEAELIEALAGKRAITVLERSDVTALTSFVTGALFKARANADGIRHIGIPAIDALPRMTTAIFGLGGHDLQSRHLIAAFDNMDRELGSAFVYLGSQFYWKNPTPAMAEVQAKLKAAYPQTEFMALEAGANPMLLPDDAFRIRFHSVGGYGTIATGKLLTDILAGVLGLNSKAAPKYGSEKSGAPTNYYITLSPEPIKITNAEIEDVEIVISPDHKVFSHTDPLKGLVEGGTFIMQSNLSPLEVWRSLPARARQTIRDRRVKFYVIDAFAVARRNAPSVELETRMMGIAFIGALCGSVERITAGAEQSAMLEKIRQQITKKFGNKGDAVVAGNMAVIQEGLEATKLVPYEDPEFLAASGGSGLKVHKIADSVASLTNTAGAFSPTALFDPAYYDETMLKPFNDGTIGESPVLPGAGLFMPPSSGASKQKGLFRRIVPLFDAEKCTACLDCTLICPDAAMPSTVHEIGDLVSTAVTYLPEDRQAVIDPHVAAIVQAIREDYKANASGGEFNVRFAAAAAPIAERDPSLAADFDAMAKVLANFPVSRSRLFFDQIEKKQPGQGGLFSVGLDPSKCSGCLECVEVCGANALAEQAQDDELLETLEERFEFLMKTPNTPSHFTEQLTGPNAKRLILDRDNYYATTGGHGACRGCGEATAVRLVTSASHALHKKQRKAEVGEVEELLSQLADKLATIGPDDGRRARIEGAMATLERELYRLESGPTGQGPAAAIVANATGCSSVYSSTFPFTQYRDPWINSLFQDTPALAKGLFEGVAADAVEAARARRVAQLELDDAYDPAVHDKALKTLSWEDFTEEELSRLPMVFSIGGDGATYDIGFGALSRLLATRTPVKVLVLNTGGYSNTGGQASTASFTGQDADLARYGNAHPGKSESRKELGLIAAFHPKVMVVQTTAAMQGHFLSNVLAGLSRTSSPVLFDVYAGCQAENGIGDAISAERAKLAVRTRMAPLFVHDPEAGSTLAERFSLKGNPDSELDWTTEVLEYDDENGETQELEYVLTPAHFAVAEGRFKKQFRAKPLADDVEGVLVEEYIDLPPEERDGKVPFIWQVKGRKLVRLPVSAPMVELTRERRDVWRLLQALAGQEIERLDAKHRKEVDDLKQQYEQKAVAAE